MNKLLRKHHENTRKVYTYFLSQSVHKCSKENIYIFPFPLRTLVFLLSVTLKSKEIAHIFPFPFRTLFLIMWRWKKRKMHTYFVSLWDQMISLCMWMVRKYVFIFLVLYRVLLNCLLRSKRERKYVGNFLVLNYCWWKEIVRKYVGCFLAFRLLFTIYFHFCLLV